MIFKCEEDDEKDGLCIFHHPEIWREKPKRVATKFYEKVRLNAQGRNRLLCIGYNFPGIALKKACPNPIYFNNSRFHGAVDCSGATFAMVDFSGAIFSERAIFFRTRFTEACFLEATFAEVADFYGSKFVQSAYFTRATFAQEAEFLGATFAKEVDFSEARFAQMARFYRASFAGKINFSETQFAGMVFFCDATFTRHVRFYRAVFNENADFSGAKFAGAVSFYEAAFTRTVEFDLTAFAKEVDFSEVKFADSAYFTKAAFTGKVDFSEATFTEDASFSRTTFAKEAYFLDLKRKKEGSSITFDPILVFQNVAFGDPRQVRFDRFDLSNISFVATDVSQIDIGENVRWRQNRKLLDERRAEKGEVPYEKAATVCRRLRQNLESRLRYVEAGHFFVREMEIRRKNVRTRNRVIRWLRTNVFSALAWYKYFSNYGESYQRIIPWIIFIPFAAAFLTTLYTTPISCPSQIYTNLQNYCRNYFFAFFQLKSDSYAELLVRVLSLLLMGQLYIALRRQFERRYKESSETGIP